MLSAVHTAVNICICVHNILTRMRDTNVDHNTEFSPAGTGVDGVTRYVQNSMAIDYLWAPANSTDTNLSYGTQVWAKHAKTDNMMIWA